MKTADFDYALPRGLIAQHPPPQRDGARMMVLDPAADHISHAAIRDLPGFLRPGDLLVLNDSRVLPARLLGRRPDGGDAEILLLRPLDGTTRHEWEALVRPARKLPAGTVLRYQGSPLTVTVSGPQRVLLAGADDPMGEVRRIGMMPTPPYIKERLDDPGRYQTIYARREGSAAAPTAGLHFTSELLSAVRDAGVEIAFITLHVGLDTFAPVRVDNPEQHPIHREAFELGAATANAVMETRRRKGRVVAVGTTCVRTLESCATDGTVRAQEGWTDLLILPGFRFRVVDAMLTNFHLPRSSLLMLVSAFAGRDRVLRAYSEAVRLRYRFFSFGDCMFITGRDHTPPSGENRADRPSPWGEGRADLPPPSGEGRGGGPA
jgi:S-adenosylmethionine:tRNA ribosyltransferase-isomerase